MSNSWVSNYSITDRSSNKRRGGFLFTVLRRSKILLWVKIDGLKAMSSITSLNMGWSEYGISRSEYWETFIFSCITSSGNRMLEPTKKVTSWPRSEISPAILLKNITWLPTGHGIINIFRDCVPDIKCSTRRAPNNRGIRLIIWKETLNIDNQEITAIEMSPYMIFCLYTTTYNISTPLLTLVSMVLDLLAWCLYGYRSSATIVMM